MLQEESKGEQIGTGQIQAGTMYHSYDDMICGRFPAEASVAAGWLDDLGSRWIG